MTIRAFGALLGGAVLVLAMQTDLALAQTYVGGKAGGYTATFGDGFTSTKRKDRPSSTGAGGIARARSTTVKSSKSNTSDRMGGGGGRGRGLPR